MRKLDNVTLLCLDTRDPDGAVWAMQKCMSDLQFFQAVLITHAAYCTEDARITVKPVENVRNVEDYSRFMVKDIGNYFATSHVLVVQWDGFIVNPDLWDEDFMDYDYIGAPWVNQRHAVGNGGFSLRSRKLVDALQDPEVNEFNPEDYAICDRYHDLLVERYGISFAPVEIAQRFSCETTSPPGPTLGVHGVGSLHWVMSDEAHLEQLLSVPDRLLLGSIGNDIAKDCLRTNKPLSARYVLSLRFSRGTIAQKADAIKQILKQRIGYNHTVSKNTSGLKKWYKHYVQREGFLFMSCQKLLQRDQIPKSVRKILWCYDWHRLGDCYIDPILAGDMAAHYEIDVYVNDGPIDSFKNIPAIHNIYNTVKQCSKRYDLILLNDVNTRSISFKIRNHFSKLWAVLIPDLEKDDCSKRDFLTQRFRQLLQKSEIK